MFVTVHALYEGGDLLANEEVLARTRRGHVGITREPGGTLGAWQRTAMLFRDENRDEVAQQLHKAALVDWSRAGILIVGLERNYRRSALSGEFPQAWLLTFAQATDVEVYRLRNAGERLPGDQVIASEPLRGSLRASVPRPGQPPTAAFVTQGQVPFGLELERVQLQRLDRRGVVLAGEENSPTGLVPQSWYVRPFAVKTSCQSR